MKLKKYSPDTGINEQINRPEYSPIQNQLILLLLLSQNAKASVTVKIREMALERLVIHVGKSKVRLLPHNIKRKKFR